MSGPDEKSLKNEYPAPGAKHLPCACAGPPECLAPHWGTRAGESLGACTRPGGREGIRHQPGSNEGALKRIEAFPGQATRIPSGGKANGAVEVGLTPTDYAALEMDFMRGVQANVEHHGGQMASELVGLTGARAAIVQSDDEKARLRDDALSLNLNPFEVEGMPFNREAWLTLSAGWRNAARLVVGIKSFCGSQALAIAAGEGRLPECHAQRFLAEVPGKIARLRRGRGDREVPYVLALLLPRGLAGRAHCWSLPDKNCRALVPSEYDDGTPLDAESLTLGTTERWGVWLSLSPTSLEKRVQAYEDALFRYVQNSHETEFLSVRELERCWSLPSSICLELAKAISSAGRGRFVLKSDVSGDYWVKIAC